MNWNCKKPNTNVWVTSIFRNLCRPPGYLSEDGFVSSKLRVFACVNKALFQTYPVQSLFTIFSIKSKTHNDSNVICTASHGNNRRLSGVRCGTVPRTVYARQFGVSRVMVRSDLMSVRVPERKSEEIALRRVKVRVDAILP